MIPMTMEGRLLHFAGKMSEEESELDASINNYIQKGGFTRATGVTLVRRNFFISDNEDHFRNHEGFEEFYYSMDSDSQDRVKILFHCMNNDLLLELEEYSIGRSFEIHLYNDFGEEKIFIALPYHKTFIDFIKAYINGNFRVAVTVDELLLEILDYKNH